MVHVLTPKGVLVQSMPTNQLVNYTLAISPDSHFLAVGAKVAEVSSRWLRSIACHPLLSGPHLGGIIWQGVREC